MSLLSPESLESTLDTADLIAQIRITDFRSFPDSRFFARYSAEADVLSVSKGSDSQKHITITGIGGEQNGLGVSYSNGARPRKNESYVAHLKLGNDGTYSIVGGDEGLEPTLHTRAFSRNRTDGSNGEGHGAYLHWDPSFLPIPFSISIKTFSEFPSFPDAINASFQTWRTPDDTFVEFIPMGCTTTTGNYNDGINSIVLISENWPFEGTTIAVTRNFYVAEESARAGTILDSDILLNGVNHSFSTTGESGKHDIQNILTHEIGHLLGFGHETSPIDADATMYAVASTGETNKRVLHSSELAALGTAYGGAGKKTGMVGYLCKGYQESVASCAAAHTQGVSVSPLWLGLFVTWMLGLKFLAPKLLKRF